MPLPVDQGHEDYHTVDAWRPSDASKQTGFAAISSLLNSSNNPNETAACRTQPGLHPDSDTETSVGESK
jgi:hypothetical protein